MSLAVCELFIDSGHPFVAVVDALCRNAPPKLCMILLSGQAFFTVWGSGRLIVSRLLFGTHGKHRHTPDPSSCCVRYCMP